MSKYISTYFVLCVDDCVCPPPPKTISNPGKTLCAFAMCWPIMSAFTELTCPCSLPEEPVAGEEVEVWMSSSGVQDFV